jgi:hypothetical protein
MLALGARGEDGAASPRGSAPDVLCEFVAHGREVPRRFLKRHDGRPDGRRATRRSSRCATERSSTSRSILAGQFCMKRPRTALSKALALEISPTLLARTNQAIECSRSLPKLAHRVIARRCRIWSQSGHDGAWSSRSKQARFVSTRPSSHHAVRLVRFGMPPTAMISALSCSMVVRWRMAVCRISAKASSSESA